MNPSGPQPCCVIRSFIEDDIKNNMENFNSTNHEEYSPYLLDKDFFILDIHWWNREVLPSTQSHIRMIAEKLKKKIIFDNVKTPHKLFSKNDEIMSIYHAYLSQFDYHIWADLLKNPEILPPFIHFNISKSDLRALYSLARIRVQTNKKIKKSDLEDFSPIFLKQIQDALDAILKKSPGAFVKLSQTSGKNEQELKPLKSLMDVVYFLTNVHVMFKQYKSILELDYYFPKEMNLIMLGWNTRISHANEFRVFIYEHQVVGISQQNWFKYCGVEDEDCPHIASSIIERYHSFWKSSLPFQSVVLDVWVEKLQPSENSNQERFQAHLIECNPWGAYNASGSGMFHWIKDYDQLHNRDNITYFRYIIKSNTSNENVQQDTSN